MARSWNQDLTGIQSSRKILLPLGMFPSGTIFPTSGSMKNMKFQNFLDVVFCQDLNPFMMEADII